MSQISQTQTLIAPTMGVDTHRVLRNTYALLSLTLLGSALSSFIGVQFPTTSLMGTIGVLLLSLAFMFATMKTRDSGWGLVFVFLFTATMGYSLGPLLRHYIGLENGQSIVMTAAGLTGGVFLGLSAYVLTTRRNFNAMGGFLFAGLIVVVLSSILNMFLAIALLSLVNSAVSALVFSGFILYDTSRIIHGGQTNYIMATVDLYLSIINLFTSMLRLVGGRD
jgi:modulator of FtsH protease